MLPLKLEIPSQSQERELSPYLVLERERKMPPRFWPKSQLPLTEMGKVAVTFWRPSASPAKSQPV